MDGGSDVKVFVLWRNKSSNGAGMLWYDELKKMKNNEKKRKQEEEEVEK